MHRDILVKQVSSTNYQGDWGGQKNLLRGQGLSQKFPMSHEANHRGDPSPRCVAGTCRLVYPESNPFIPISILSQIAKNKNVPNFILYNVQKQIKTPWSTAKSALVLNGKEGLELQV